MNYINKSEEINVNKETIFNLINNVDNYQKFLPWCTNSKILTKKNSSMTAEIEISKSFVNWKFTTENNYKANKIIELKLVDGPFSHLEGHWKFDEIDEFNTQVSLYLV